ncbi:hypothetical protein Tcan_12065 [Toxocara canis]|uniref:Uncharacterized protein n=1 Tax=Toxocara canis TaxID=6265 RepID=A0A0B2UPT3_TOXCA|nr:hypothetical protein Tcan_12065 [Toxocara canis]
MKSIAVESECKHVPSGSFFPCHRSDLCLAVLKRHHAFQFFGAFDLQVLHGSVKAHGYDFEAAAYNEKKFIPICAPYMLGPPITVFSTPSEDAINFGRLKWRIQEVSNAAAAILEIIRIGDAVLLLRFLASKAALCARNLHDVILFIPSSGDSLMLDSLCCVLRTQWNVCINSTDQSFVAVIDYLQKRRCRFLFCFTKSFYFFTCFYFHIILRFYMLLAPLSFLSAQATRAFINSSIMLTVRPFQSASCSVHVQ